jgi:putative flippase GtrA/ribosomal protein S18 acetylase RimI-like enzyme
MSAPVIVPLTEHVDAVARLHCDNLNGLLSQLGLAAARAYYTGCVRSSAAVGFASLEDGVVAGYVVGSAHPEKLKSEVLRRNLVGTVAAVCLGIVRRPVSLAWLLKSFRGPDDGRYNGEAAELTYIAVAAGRRTAGVGKGLVDAFTCAMRAAGESSYELSVDDDNQAAIGFYEKLGFRRVGQYREFGTLHYRYRLEILPGANAPTAPAPGPSRTLLARVFRYGCAGVSATLVYFGAVTALVEVAGLNPVRAAVPATMLVIVLSYAINRAWVFDTDRSHVSAFARFVAASVLSLVLNTSLMYLSVQVMGWRYLAGLILATAVVPPTNFVINYLWCFQAA